MKKIFKITLMVVALFAIITSCVKDLDTKPIDPDDYNTTNVYKDQAGYKQVLAKLYAGLSMSGQQGPAGKPDIKGIDEGFGEYIRGYWYHQELTTDEAVIGWNDQTVKNFHSQNWGSNDVFIAAMYYRIFYQIGVCNEFIRESTIAKLDERGISGAAREEVLQYRNEARFLRALSYYHALDLFGNVPFVTENDPVGKFFPPRKERKDLFAYIESELLAVEQTMSSVKSPEYGRAGKAAVWTLLAKLYLNAEVYLGAGNVKYNECVTNCKKVIDAGYTLDPDYAGLFKADNHLSNEVIFAVNFDGTRSQTWGGTTFLIHAAVGGKMAPADYGIGSGWAGLRTTSALVNKFPENSRSMWWLTTTKPPKSTNVYPVLYVPGSYQGWDPTNTTTVIGSVQSNEKYEGYFNFPAGTKFKLTTQPNWDYDFGEDPALPGTLKVKGNDIQVPEEGFFKLNVDTTLKTFTLLKTTWGLIGDATVGKWETDQPMTYNTSTGSWEITLDLTLGGVKFRANSGWDLNYGDDGANGILEPGGANIAISGPGQYKVSLKLGAPDYTYTIVLVTPPPPPSIDYRPIFFTDGQSLEINDISVFSDGYAVPKFTNMTSGGAAGSNQTFVDTDFPMFRLADVYLMYAEAVLRGGNGSSANSLNYVNLIRTRAYTDLTGNIDATELTPDFILNERARELYWEGHRRTDLIRFGKFSDGDYRWPWKGGVKDGKSVQPFYNLFPIPASDVIANPNLEQNTGY